MCCLQTQIVIIYRVAMDFSFVKKIRSLLKICSLKKYMTFHSNRAMSLSSWIISDGVLYTFHLLFSKFIQPMVTISFSDVIYYKNLLNLKSKEVSFTPKVWSVVCQFNLLLRLSIFGYAR